MAYTIRRAYKAIAATSSTTAFAFLSNGFSSLMPVSAFGYFAAVVVPVNYILIVFYWPAFIVLYEIKFRFWERAVIKCCLRSCKCFYCRKCSHMYRKQLRLEKYRREGGKQKWKTKYKVDVANEPVNIMEGVYQSELAKYETAKRESIGKDVSSIVDGSQSKTLQFVSEGVNMSRGQPIDVGRSMDLNSKEVEQM